MANQSITLIGAANLFGVHPRTIVRAISGNHNTYWTEDIDENLYNKGEVADAYGLSVAELNRVIEGRDALLTPDEAAKLLNIKPRTFRDRVKAGRYRKVTNGGIVRYFRSKILEDLVANTQE